MDIAKKLKEKGFKACYDEYQSSSYIDTYEITMFQKIASLGAGEGFGELALENTEPRAATINVGDEPAKFATFSKLDYEHIIKRS